MWRRFKRMVQANLGRLSVGGAGRGLTGDLDREARDLDRALKQAADALATVKGEVTFLEDKLRKLGIREQELEAMERAAEGRGSSAASTYGLELARVRSERAAAERQLGVAREAVQRGVAARTALQAQRERKLVEAKERERALLDLEREDAALRPTPASSLDDPLAPAPAPIDESSRLKTVGPASSDGEDPTTGPVGAVKTVGGTLGGTLGAAPPPPAARPVKTIGPVGPPAEAPPAAPASPAEPIKIKVRPVEPARVEPARVEPARDPGSAPTGRTVIAGTAVAAAATTPPAPDLVVELERLARLRAQGVLTEEELEQAKRRLLAAGPEPVGGA